MFSLAGAIAVMIAEDLEVAQIQTILDNMKANDQIRTGFVNHDELNKQIAAIRDFVPSQI